MHADAEQAEQTPALVRAARKAIPARIRQFLGSAIGGVGWSARDVYWKLMSSRQRTRWVERRLLIAPYSWLFVVGVTNSGTTVLTRLLERHPRVRGFAREGQFTSHALPRPDDFGDGRLWALQPDRYRWTEADDPAPALRCMFDWSWHYPRRPGVLLEKSPPNLLRMRWLQANFTPARFLIITRDPYAVCEGIRRRRPDCTIEQAAEQWVAAHEIMFDDLPMIEHHMRVSYEQLCDRPMETFESVRAFLELDQPFDTAVLEEGFTFRHGEYERSTLGNQNRKAIDRLSAADVEAITGIAGPMMQRLGYSQREPAAASPSDAQKT